MPLIYVVEDSPTTRGMLRAALEEAGYGVRTLESAEEALAAIEEAPPDLVVTDVVLPGRTGIALTEELRETYGRMELPVIVVSSRDHLDDVARGYEAGADDYLTKPVDPVELVQKARLFLARRERATGEGSSWTRYELRRLLGRGQTASTYLARRRGDGLELALKVLKPGASPDAVTRLLREAELLRDLEDVPGIVKVRDVGSDGGSTYYAMDLVPGETLRARLDRDGRLPSPEAAVCCRSLASSLAALAAGGVVHGDVKPSNVLHSDAGTVLIDFGLARRADEPSPGRGGTLTYLAPEVVQGGESTPRADVYSLGVVLFEALTGELPYAATGADLAALKVEGARPDLAPLLALDPAPGLVAIVEEAIQPDPAARTARASEVAVALLPYSTREPAAQPEESP